MKFSEKNWHQVKKSVSAFTGRLKAVPIDKFRRTLKKKGVLYFINPVYFAFRDFDLYLRDLEYEKKRKQQFSRICDQLVRTRWSEELLLVVIESLRDCRKNNVAGGTLVAKDSPFLTAMVKIHDPKAQGEGQLALRNFLRHEGLLKPDKRSAIDPAVLPEKLPQHLAGALDLYQKLGLDETDLYLKPPVKEAKLAKYHKNDRKYPSVILEFLRSADGTGTDELGGSDDFYSFQGRLEDTVAEQVADMKEDGHITKKSKPIGIQKQFPLKTLFAVGVTLSGDVIFLDLKQRDRKGNIPLYYLHHDSPLKTTLYFSSLGEYLAHLMCAAYKRRHGVHLRLQQGALADGRGSMVNVKKAYT